MAKLDDIITKSLEEIDELAKGLVSGTEGNSNTDNLSKSDPEPNEVSDSAPEEEEEEPGQEPNEEPGGEPEQEQEDEPEEEPEEDPDEESAEKSLEDELNGDDSVRKALEVSEFLDSLVKGLSKVIGDNTSAIKGQQDTIVKSLEATTQNTDILAKSFQGIIKSQRAVLETQSELSKSIRRLSKRIETIESQPMPRKAALNVVEKSFKASMGDESANAPTSDKLNKSEVLAKLNNAFSQGNTNVMNDILAFESMGDIRVLSPEAMAVINTK
ncbi:MAG: hypothetical protein Q8910_00795 [Bacteroidota bacterium]|nr:hypothetical protein [Bacteroidota bacterium]